MILSAPLWAEKNNITAQEAAQTTTYYKIQFYNRFQQSLINKQKNIINNENNTIDKDFETEIKNIGIEEDVINDIENNIINNEETYIIDDIFSTYIDLDVPSGKSFKSYMDARHITNKSSVQYQLKSQYELDNSGIYMIDGRYTCAIGSYYSTDVGTKFDIVMKSGEIIPCILADCKADEHTDNLGQYTVANGSIVEFVVHEATLIPNISTQWGNTGDVSTLGGIFEGEISYIRIYF